MRRAKGRRRQKQAEEGQEEEVETGEEEEGDGWEEQKKSSRNETPLPRRLLHVALFRPMGSLGRRRRRCLRTASVGMRGAVVL